MRFSAVKGQTSYGEVIGILLLDTYTPFIHGDVGNAASYGYPVRFKRVDGLTVERIFDHDLGFAEKMINAAMELEREGVKAITGDCGFMAIYQKEVQASVSIPVFLSSLLQIPFIKATLREQSKIGVITANAKSLTPDILSKIGVDNKSLVISGLEDQKNFKEAAIDEIGLLDSDKISEEVCSVAKDMTSKHPEVESILLECSLLPAYGAKVRRVTGLPVYDYLTMIDYVCSSILKKKFMDIM